MAGLNASVIFCEVLLSATRPVSLDGANLSRPSTKTPQRGRLQSWPRRQPAGIGSWQVISFSSSNPL